ncbi:ArgP/LysG family DNA-binding transcriptional regulator [Serinibacter arcticus]|uniref:ArgP/LysG family DNA-binding transcriptional regulator n=1 Tax=Serinibacter arcticus TaxID=1655435 RepID=A0A2U1ZVI9_9MICO|nr:LysR family transcriptional regulator ArgP [Serinibacter arcticus]PWD51007.1 ArgP/LysG family DNA-binding transcriptional regulator [Serinibacter arcticus]
MDWDLPQLRALAAAVEAGSLDAAARALHLTPSAVSQRLKALEQQVGAVLLQRTRPVRPTEAGVAVLRLAREIEALTADAQRTLSPAPDGGPAWPRVRLAVNADSLATWVLPALAPLAADVLIEFLREDQDRTADLLRDGTAMGALTSQAAPVQGCTVEALGTMRYHPLASAAFVRRWFPDGVTPAALAVAPMVVFDDADALQHEALRRRGVDGEPPFHVVPASAQFADAVRLGYGWGMLPELQVDAEAEGLVRLDPTGAWREDVPLFWQQWSLHTPSLDAVADALRTAARAHLR